ncbi:metallophosphoesterase [Rhizobium sp. Root1220]|uniref:metallophosphoesterase n=1 Tax=Rhizobium sp. Root1220 TaxID=1736432 RepID=UPI0006FF2292|nr:metallophosphoesterase [Rhizobium sp. Root1220]KQV73242.1 phosphatase [Rhizobium sp. Root1220]
MKLWPISDLHLEFGVPFDHRLPEGTDVVVCAGDVTTKGIIPSLQWLADNIAPEIPVVCVAGNHEFYGGFVQENIRDARKFANGFPNIHFLENETVDIGNMQFIGGTLWTDFQLFGREAAFAMADAEAGMNDYRRIKFTKRPYKKFKPIHAFRKHQETRNFIAAAMEGSAERTTVVLTHHAPSSRSVPSWYREGSAVACYASHLESLILDAQPALWIHGHLHNRSDYHIGQTRVVSNPRGYPGERTGFDPGFVVEIGANLGSNEELVQSALAILDRVPDVAPDPEDD